ncbi:MAG TPA: type I methionyl aminopeptidase, partial [Halomonas sp.]|nr:type I methionyl aminopeptidase [Halomonas sp.]
MSRVTLKTPEELQLLREAGRLLAQVFGYLDARIEPGISTMDINRWVERYIVD